MTIDTSRAAFVQQAYRYASAADHTVKAVYPNAKAVAIDSNLSLEIAQAIADQMLEETSSAAMVFNIPVEGIYTVDAFSGGPLRFALTASEWSVNGRVFKLVGLKVDDYSQNRATLKVRG